MNVDTNHQGAYEAGDPQGGDLLSGTFKCFQPFRDKVADLSEALDKLIEIGDDTTAKAARRLGHQLAQVEPSVTMIGQVKAGKTSLVNAMVGWPGLLPADVNPWTSVVTSLRLAPDSKPEDQAAAFTFFDEGEWGRLVDRGGRVGELAERAGAAEELDKVRAQVEDMRRKSERRLGRKFEMLLGQSHDYGYIDTDLVERYVCLGDDFETDTETSTTQGRFADITKSADLTLHVPGVPMKLCIRDTPGVNDTFMMREQITIRAIRESRMCVVVLSAHQALSTVDMALIRLISNVKSREVIIFVNRIDELQDPANEVPQIRASIEKTLAEHQGPEGVEILFGSAGWANTALSGAFDEMSEASSNALLNWADEELRVPAEKLSIQEVIWELSGLPALYRAIAERVDEGAGGEAVEKAARSAINLANGVRAAAGYDGLPISTGGANVDTEALRRAFAKIETAAGSGFDSELDAAVEDFERRLDRSHRSFLERATSSLLAHLESEGDGVVWEYDPTGFRVLLRSAYQVFGRNLASTAKRELGKAAKELETLYQSSFGLADGSFKIEAPRPARMPPPVLLGQTIALDLKGSWWSRWWQRRRGYSNYAMDFAQMIEGETLPIIDALRGDNARAIRNDAAQVMADFLSEQKSILENVLDKLGETGGEDVSLAEPARKSQQDELERTVATLEKLAA
ncbi:MAG: dynamin family protein [Paracoccaceae bacterium]|nr:dynamin family protein [Paracoccaceae bacterium]